MDAIAAFKRDHLNVWTWIVENPDFEFAASLGEAVLKYGSLNERQLAAAQKCIAKRDEARAERERIVATAPTANVGRILEAFNNAAASGLKNPKLRLAEFDFSLASPHSRNPGAIYVKGRALPGNENSANIDGEYLGKIMDGKFIRVRSCDGHTEARVLEVCADPEAAAVMYGTVTGKCGCCGRELTNPESVERGIGPICASKYGW